MAENLGCPYDFVYLNPDGGWVTGFRAEQGAPCFRDYGSYQVPACYFAGWVES